MSTTKADSGDVETEFAFDDFGRRTSRTSPDSGLTSYTYFPNDLVATRTDADNITLTYQYDALNRLTQILKNDSTSLVSYGYDETVDGVEQKGRLTSMTDASGNAVYLYNIHGELVKETRTTAGQVFVTEYGYTGNGEVEHIIYPSDRKVTWNRDETGQLTSVTSLYEGKVGFLAKNIVSKPFGPITGLKAGNDLVLSRSVDSLYRLSGITGGGLYERTYSYWSDGLVRNIVDPASTDHAYSYDDLGQLDTATVPAGSFDFDHDGVGNRLSRTVDSVDTTGYNYASGTNRLNQSTGAVAASFGYDNSGNIATDSTDTTVYNLTDDQRLASVTKNGVTAGAYQYDGRGLRTVKAVNGETTLFIYCKSGKLIAEADSNGNIHKEYVYLEGNIFAHFLYEVPGGALEEAIADGESLPEIAPDPVAAETSEKAVPSFAVETSTPSNTAFLQAVYMILLLQNKSAEGAYYYITDHLGAPHIITDDSGSVVWQAEYLPFGKVNISVAQIENNLRFPGQYFDAETGLHYNWNRYYNPETGRYIAADPIGLGGGINLFAYVGGDPVNGFDLWGLMEFDGIEPFGEPTYVNGFTHGWEAHFIVGVGQFRISCCDEELNVEVIHQYRKICVGAAFDLSYGAGQTSGTGGKSCSNPPRKLLGGELGAFVIEGGLLEELVSVVSRQQLVFIFTIPLSIQKKNASVINRKELYDESIYS